MRGEEDLCGGAHGGPDLGRALFVDVGVVLVPIDRDGSAAARNLPPAMLCEQPGTYIRRAHVDTQNVALAHPATQPELQKLAEARMSPLSMRMRTWHEFLTCREPIE